MMKVIFCLCFCGMSIGLFAQGDLRTFTSPDGAFRFKYSPVLIRCSPQPEGQSRSWVPADECNSQAAICGVMFDSSTTIVCFAHPTHEYFSGAFFVAEVQPAGECMEHWPNTTCKPLPIKRKECLAASSNWWPPETPLSTMRGQNAKIDSVRAKVFRVSDAWTSGGQTGDIYRVFHGNKCYELGIQEAGANSTPFDPEEFEKIEKVEKEDHEKYGPLLLQALHSFRFLAARRPPK
jgi:hypothetical protein